MYVDDDSEVGVPELVGNPFAYVTDRLGAYIGSAAIVDGR
jgi:hypothetical protein